MVPIPWYGEQKHLGRAGREQSAMGVREACPAWGSKRCKSNGPRHTGNQNHHCKVCGRPFIFDATKGVMTESNGPWGSAPARAPCLASACRRSTMRTLSSPLPLPPTPGGRSGRDGALRAAQGEHTRGLARPGHADTAHPGVPHRGIAATRGHNSGGRMGRQHPASRRRARRSKMPSPPGSCRRPTRKPSRSTPGNPILVRASSTRCGSCIARLVRDTLGFSTKLANPIGAITYCIGHDNLIRAAAFLVEHYQVDNALRGARADRRVPLRVLAAYVDAGADCCSGTRQR